MMSSLASTAMTKNVTSLTPPILNHNRKRFVRRISSKNVSLSTKNQPVKKVWNFAIPLWFVKVKVPRNVGLFTSHNVKLGNF